VDQKPAAVEISFLAKSQHASRPPGCVRDPIDDIAQRARRAVASVRLARARAITLAHFRSHGQSGPSLIGFWYFGSRGSPNSVMSRCNGIQRAAGLAIDLQYPAELF